MAYPGDGLFLPTTFPLQSSNVKNLKVDQSTKEVFLELYNILNDISTKVNLKDSAIYGLREFLTGGTFFSDPALNSTTPQTPVPRPEFRMVVNFGQLPNATTKSVAHGITSPSFIVTDVYAGATDSTAQTGIRVSYASPVLADNIEIYTDGINVNIKTGKDRTNFDICHVVIKYLKS